MREKQVGQWTLRVLQPQLDRLQERLAKTLLGINDLLYIPSDHGMYSVGSRFTIDFLLAALQDGYDLRIHYEKDGSTVQLSEPTGLPAACDRFPPLPFCHAVTKEDWDFLCTELERQRKGVTIEHPYAAWLLENAAALETEFPSQWETLVYWLREANGASIREAAASLRAQIARLRDAGLTAIPLPPELTKADFWERR